MLAKLIKRILNKMIRQPFLRIRNRFQKPFLDARIFLPVIIFQPGKVGSSSVQISLQEKYNELGIFVPVYHAHVLLHTESRIQYILQNRSASVSGIEKLKESSKLRELVKSNPDQGWNIINLVREPVAMKVSALFQVFHGYIPDWEDRYKKGESESLIHDLDELLYKGDEFGPRGLKWWYDNEIMPLWGIDVFKTPFSKEKGYQIYRQNNINLLVIRLEDLNRVAGQAFEEYMGMKEFEIINANVGGQKAYAELYQKFKKRPLLDNYVNSLCDTDFARHFYTQDEIEKFRRNWIAPELIVKS